MKILLAVDGSKNSLDAVKSLIEHAGWYRAKPAVELVTVHLPLPRLPGMSLVVGRNHIQDYYGEQGEACLAAAKKKLLAARIPFKAHILVGQVAEMLVQHAKKTRCDLIFIGTRGRSAAANLLLGSTATKVLHLATVPVLLVK